MPSASRNPLPADSARPGDDARGWALVFTAWLVAATSTLGALFFGEVMGLSICVLCWYQRIFMFPLALILPFGLLPFDPKVIRYALPLAGCGMAVAVFHQLLVAGVIPENIKPCTQGVPCSTTVASWFGFLTIPLMSILAFSLVFALLLAALFRSSR